jgi:hypothetical protein
MASNVETEWPRLFSPFSPAVLRPTPVRCHFLEENYTGKGDVKRHNKHTNGAGHSGGWGFTSGIASRSFRQRWRGASVCPQHCRCTPQIQGLPPVVNTLDFISHTGGRRRGSLRLNWTAPAQLSCANFRPWCSFNSGAPSDRQCIGLRAFANVPEPLLAPWTEADDSSTR